MKFGQHRSAAQRAPRAASPGTRAGRPFPFPVPRLRLIALVLLLPAALLLPACNNNPYPSADAETGTYYTSYSGAHRTLDPAEAYNVSAHHVTGLVYDTLLEYHYLKRPFTLIPGLATEVPKAQPQADGGVLYRFRMREGVGYSEDPCFAPGPEGLRTREATAEDIAYQLQRLADPELKVQVRDAFARIRGFRAFMQALDERRKADPAFARRSTREQYRLLGGMEGVRVTGRYELEIELSEPYPQILYWFATEFTTPVPHEAVEYYDAEEGRDRFADHPVGTGPYYITDYQKRLRILLERNPHWYGLRHPDAPGARYPETGEPGDAEAGLLDPGTVGRGLPFIDRIEFRLEKESIPLFNKFLQGYYDRSGIIKESFDQVVQNDRLTPEMEALGISLRKATSPSVFYLGFNMEDEVVGAPAGHRGRLLRRAMSLAVDSGEWIRLFLNGRGIEAQNPVPPVLAGYPARYRNPYRQVNLERARALLAEAGYPEGIDPATGKPLHLTFDTYTVSSQGLLEREFFLQAWRKIGLDVELAATTYNEFNAKVERLAYQLFFWGWSADYPDPENFLFLLTCDMRRSKHGGPNTSNFCDPRYDALFDRMEVMPDGPEREAVIREMLTVLEQERPWVELFHRVDYSLTHPWLSNVKPFGMSYPMYKYYELDAQRRAELRTERNRPVLWPAFALAGVFLVGVLPGVRTFFRERQ